MERNFEEDLEYSLRPDIRAHLCKFYLNKFGRQLHTLSLIFDEQIQRSGIDAALKFQGSPEKTVDEKVRRDVWPDIALETFSNYRTKRQGWIYTCQADLICYAFEPELLEKDLAYLLDHKKLKSWFEKNEMLLRRSYRQRFSRNPGYETEFVPVPKDIVMEAAGI